MMMYSQDYDGHLPPKQRWCNAVLPYLGSPRGSSPRAVFQCPSLPGQPSGQAYNPWLSAVAIRQIRSPSTTVTLFDARGGWNMAGGSSLADPRHNQGLNALFADGHVWWLRSLDRVTWQPGPPMQKAPLHRRGNRRHRGRRA
jgi:prepilin-type processing-associated H-X9-DG protein